MNAVNEGGLGRCSAPIGWENDTGGWSELREQDVAHRRNDAQAGRATDANGREGNVAAVAQGTIRRASSVGGGSNLSK